ncbi:MAG: hypothetical protein A3F15_00110 [Candidatus Wildermuthbacteria bacterium RIFCSPHIGHO2_12_FULL_40_12]|uniref:Transcription factor zinc-finger domain-containing protein n=1 Tax=Candidatus Wildermuthbacteria bacterium RIFCSPHIGHO2_12_FULL_40_12 TaxID=1802457 RepID=A0A1G2RD01_9BACT|nr:MAG: hypothetical protein A3F15_00110 [Candidatus Wildermuthbacteria bacterium RIFCSPHIGHO2_12_FULL_40_12]
MSCPICKKDFEKAIFYGAEVDYCLQCLGLWFEEEELRWTKDVKDRDLRWLDIDLWKDKTKLRISRGIRLCPHCRLPLYEVYYGDSKIVVDICNLCHGLWLDRGEFKKIIGYLKEQSDSETLNHYAQNLTAEFWEVFSGPEGFREELHDFLAILKILSYKFFTQHPNIARLISNLPR